MGGRVVWRPVSHCRKASSWARDTHVQRCSHWLRVPPQSRWALSLILGGGRLDGFSKLYVSLCSAPPVRGGIRFWKAFKQGATTGYTPQDGVGEVAQTPPSSVDDVALIPRTVKTRFVTARPLRAILTSSD